MTNLKLCSTAFAALMISTLPALAGDNDEFRGDAMMEHGEFGTTSTENNSPEQEKAQETDEVTDTSVEEEGAMEDGAMEDGMMNVQGFVTVMNPMTTDTTDIPIGIAAQVCDEVRGLTASTLARGLATTAGCVIEGDDIEKVNRFAGGMTDGNTTPEDTMFEESRENEEKNEEDMGGGQGGNGQQGQNGGNGQQGQQDPTGQQSGKGGDREGERD